MSLFVHGIQKDVLLSESAIPNKTITHCTSGLMLSEPSFV